MAEYVFKVYAAKVRKDWQAESCGIAADRRFQTPEGVRKALARYGVEKVERAPRLVSPELMAWATDVFAMAANHRAVLQELYPGHRNKIHLFLEKAGLGARDVEDPVGKPVERYIDCCEIIDGGIRKLLEIHDRSVCDPTRGNG